MVDVTEGGVVSVQREGNWEQLWHHRVVGDQGCQTWVSLQKTLEENMNRMLRRYISVDYLYLVSSSLPDDEIAVSYTHLTLPTKA